MRVSGEWFVRSLFASLFLVLPAAADVVDYQVCCVVDYDNGVKSAITIPAFDPSKGQLQSVTYDVQFTGQLMFQADSSGNGSVNYSASIFPILDLGDPLDLNFHASIFKSGTMMVQSGVAYISFTGSDQINGPALPSTQNVSVQFRTSGVGSPDDGSWFLSSDSASLDVQYSYTPPDSPLPSGPSPSAVPEPRLLWPIAILLPITLWGQRKFAARRVRRTRITLE